MNVTRCSVVSALIGYKGGGMVSWGCLSSQRDNFLKIENRYKQSKSQRDALMKKKLK